VSDKTRTGRPLKEHPAGTQVTITLQVPAELKTRLQEHALKSNRTLSQEAQRRLERSFSIQAHHEDAIALAVEEANARFSEQMAKKLSEVHEEATATIERLAKDMDEKRAVIREAADEMLKLGDLAKKQAEIVKGSRSK
jgi:uncharacterized protein YllA (UPF0747 family)